MKTTNLSRAQNMVLRDKYDFDEEVFCKELSAFLSDWFFFDSLTVNPVAGKGNNLVLCVNVKNVKGSKNVS